MSTPMMAQFNELKKQYNDSILFFRMGDFYEMFGDDAVKASKILGIALTSRNKNVDDKDRVPMCGIPYHSYSQYMLKLIKSGHKVAICEQLEDPATAKGLVKRGVIRVVSAGTVIDDNEINEVDNNFLTSIYISSTGSYSVCNADISTGEIYLTTVDNNLIGSILASYSPKEVLTSSELGDLFGYKSKIYKDIPSKLSEEKVCSLFKVSSIKNLGLDTDLCIALDMVLRYVEDAMIDFIPSRPHVINNQNKLVMDSWAVNTLELIKPINEGGMSLYDVLNKTLTPMGARLLKRWLSSPSRDMQIINSRLDKVDFFVSEWGLTVEIKKLLKNIYDIERIANRVASKRVTPRELIWLKNSLVDLPVIADVLEGTLNEDLTVFSRCFKNTTSIIDIIDKAIKDDPPVNIKDGDIIKSGYSKYVDEYKDIKANGRQHLASLEAKLKKETGINQLKISYNKVFGYYIEVSKGNLSKVPNYFERKQTLVNSERFITDELKQLEYTILNAEDKLGAVEYEIFCAIRDEIAGYTDLLREVAGKVGLLDCYLCFADVSVTRGYVRPIIDNSGKIEVNRARHAVVEASSHDLFVANDIHLDSADNRLIILTGPNMSGKSTYIRSVALIVIMAHIGCHVPASSARIGLVDRVFTRVGASDNISRGESTFMVEMVETANILANATANSLVILDEVGRGTSTYDGLSIAWAICEYLLNKIKVKTLFATHYHELTDIESKGNGAVNYTVHVKEDKGEVIFLRRIIRGCADKSYGIHVADLAGIPKEVINRASSILSGLEDKPSSLHSNTTAPNKGSIGQVYVRPILIFDDEHPCIKELQSINLDHLTPMEAFAKLGELKTLSLKTIEDS